MKKIILAISFIFSTQIFAADLATTIRNIEIKENAKCTKTDTSTALCLGGAQGVCYYNVKFSCVSNSGTFSLKVKMKNSTVRKIIRY